MSIYFAIADLPFGMCSSTSFCVTLLIGFQNRLWRWSVSLESEEKFSNEEGEKGSSVG